MQLPCASMDLKSQNFLTSPTSLYPLTSTTSAPRGYFLSPLRSLSLAGPVYGLNPVSTHSFNPYPTSHLASRRESYTRLQHFAPRLCLYLLAKSHLQDAVSLRRCFCVQSLSFRHDSGITGCPEMGF